MNTEDQLSDHSSSRPARGKGKKGIVAFLFNVSVPAGIRLLVLSNAFFAFYFFVTFAVFAAFIAVQPEGIETVFVVISGYHLVAGFVLALSVFPLSYGRSWARKVSLLGSILVIGYSLLWFIIGELFSLLGFVFLLMGALSGLYIAYSSAARRFFGDRGSYTILQ